MLKQVDFQKREKEFTKVEASSSISQAPYEVQRMNLIAMNIF